MTTTRQTFVAAAFGFAAGAVLATLVVTAIGGADRLDDPAIAVGSAGTQPAVRTAHPVPRAERARGGAPASDAPPGTPAAAPAAAGAVVRVLPDITDEEAAFLRAALDAERNRRKEAAVRDGDDGLGIMKRYVAFGADVSPVLSSYDTMRAHVRVPAGPARRIDATGGRTTVDLTKDLGDATVVEFGPGTFVLTRGDGRWNVRQADVEALEIRGAGMDKTTLVGPGWAFLCMEEKASLRNLVVKDLTIDGAEQGQIILDARGGIAAALERVRITGWQVAGHAAPLGVSGNAFLACSECEFVGPGDGFVLSLRGMALATFDRCRFTDAQAAFIGPGGTDQPAVVAVRDCTFDNIRLADSRVRGTKGGGVTLRVAGGTAAAGASAWTEEKRREWWGAAYAASVEGVTFTAAKPLFPFSELLRAVDLAAAAGIRDIVSMEAFPRARGTPVEIDFYVFDREKAAVVRRTRRLTAIALEDVEKEPRRGMHGATVKSAAEIDGVLPIGDLLRRMGLADDESYSNVELRPLARAPDGQQMVWLSVQTPGSGAPVVVDARTGAVLQKR